MCVCVVGGFLACKPAANCWKYRSGSVFLTSVSDFFFFLVFLFCVFFVSHNTNINSRVNELKSRSSMSFLTRADYDGSRQALIKKVFLGLRGSTVRVGM